MKEIAFIYESLMLEDDDFIISGLMVAGDHQDVTLKQISIFNSPVTVKKIATLIQDGYPVRQKGIHFFNMPSIMVTLFNLFKSLLNEKNRSRVKEFKKFCLIYCIFLIRSILDSSPWKWHRGNCKNYS